MRKIIYVLVTLAVVLFLNVPVSAAPSYKVYLNDSQDLLTDYEEQRLLLQMDRILPYGNAGFISVSQHRDTEVYAKDTYKELFGEESGILFVIDMGERNIWIHSNGDIYKVINKAYAYTITDNVYRYATKGEYYRCAEEAFDQARILLEGGKIAQPMKHISNALIALVIALLINFIVLITQRQRKVPSPKDTFKAMSSTIGLTILAREMTKSKKTRHIESSSSSSDSSGSWGGGGYSGGGGGSSSSSSGGGGGGHKF